MNPLIRKKIPLEYETLWKLSRQKKLESRLHDMVREKIKEERNLYKYALEKDVLEEKQKEFPQPGSWGLKKVQELAKELYQDKGVGSEDVGKWISVEIECILKNKEAEMRLVSFLRKNGFQKFVTIKQDGSIHVSETPCNCERDDDGDLISGHRPECEHIQSVGRELVLSFKYGEWEFLRSICKELNKLGTKINKTCGLHVHFDCRHFSTGQTQTIGKRVAGVVPALKMILPKSRQSNRFCEQTINGFESGPRYSFVNLQAYSKHKTIEIRGHSGTTDPEKIINWIKILKTIMETRGAKEAATVEDLISKYKFEEVVSKYILGRQKTLEERYTKKKKIEDDILEDNAVMITEELLTEGTETAANSTLTSEADSPSTTPHTASLDSYTQDALDHIIAALNNGGYATPRQLNMPALDWTITRVNERPETVDMYDGPAIEEMFPDEE